MCCVSVVWIRKWPGNETLVCLCISSLDQEVTLEQEAICLCIRRLDQEVAWEQEASLFVYQ